MVSGDLGWELAVTVTPPVVSDQDEWKRATQLKPALTQRHTFKSEKTDLCEVCAAG